MEHYTFLGGAIEHERMEHGNIDKIRRCKALIIIVANVVGCKIKTLVAACCNECSIIGLILCHRLKLQH